MFFRRRRWRRSGRSLASRLLADTVIHMNSAARLVCHGDYLLVGGGGALGGVAGRWANGLGAFECPPLGLRGWGDIPLSSYISTSIFSVL